MKLGLIFALGCAACSPVSPASSAPARSAGAHTTTRYPVYRLDFTLSAKEGTGSGDAGTGESTRHYSLVLEQGSEGRVQAGSNVPLVTRERVSRVDAGVNVRCRFDPDGDDILLHTELTMSNAGSGDVSVHALRKVEMVGNALVAPGTPSLVATIADPPTQTRYELSVAATRLY